MSTLIIADLGSSLIKVVYTGKNQQPHPLAIRPEVVSVMPEQIQLQLEQHLDNPLHSMFVETNGQLYALSDFALNLNGIQYHELSKWSDLTPRLLGVLGMVAHQLSTHHLEAQLTLLMPMTEAQLPNRNQQMKDLTKATKRFKFRGQVITCDLNIKMNVEGSGLYAGHAAYLRSQRQRPELLNIPVLMGGERNTSLIVYQGSKLNLQQSSSTAGGFYQYANQALIFIGAQMKLTDLIGAIAAGKKTIRAAGNEVVDISTIAQNAIQLYGEHLVKLVRAKLPTGEVNVIAGGGALQLIWAPLNQWFKQAGIAAFYLNPLLQRNLDDLFKEHPLIQSQQHRFADAIGSYWNTKLSSEVTATITRR